jgi:lysophospholipase L1-like esterase
LTCTDSITYGFKSSDGNGYRKALRDILTGAGNKVDMIGSVKAGSMDDNDNEGHSGFTITQIAAFKDAYKQRPNVVLLHAGTNDMNKPDDPDNAPQRLNDLVATLIAALPDATIVVARIIPAGSSSTLSRIRVYNNAITKLMATRALRGEKVMIVDMPSGVQTKDLADGLHPNDQGYRNMAIKWAIILTAADSLGWIEDPLTGGSPGQPSRDFCPHDPTWLPQGEVASGGGLGPNLWLRATCFTK